MNMKKNINAEESPKNNVKKKWIIIGAIVVILIGIAATNGNNDGSQTSSTPDSTAASTTTAESTTESAADTTEHTSEAEPTTEAQTETETAPESEAESTEPVYSLEFGKLVSVVTNEIDGKNVIVVKAKITPKGKNKDTINQNYFNVEDLIQEQGCDTFDELQYWAVADLTDGLEQKVVAFTVNSSLIKMIADGSVPANQLGDYVDDLYILPSLQR